MASSFALVIIGIVIGGIALLVSLIFTIIKLAGGKNQQAGIWAAGFVVSLTVVIFSVVHLVGKIKEKVKETADMFQNSAYNGYENSENDYMKSERQYWLDTLDLYTNQMFRNKMPADFYKNEEVKADVDGKMILPFLYPYSIKFDSYNYVGDIIANDSVFVSNVSEFAFDENFVIVRIDNRDSQELLKKGHSEIEYLLFDMRTGNYESAANKEKLMDLAARIGYTGAQNMKAISTAYTGWIGYQEYD